MDMIATPHSELADSTQRALLAAVEGGLPLVERPYAVIGERIGLGEEEVIGRLQRLLELGVIKRLGVVVRHRELGYHANAMVVWDIPDERVRETGRCLSQYSFVTLCYRRPRRLPQWPYNLFTMIHGHDRDGVLARVEEIVENCGLQEVPHQALFSARRFKQRGARYGLGASAVSSSVPRPWPLDPDNTAEPCP